MPVPKKIHLIIFAALAIVLLVAFIVKVTLLKPAPAAATPTPTPVAAAVQLPANELPTVSLSFSSDAHYATVNITNIHADQLEYDLIYTASVKNNDIQTGVNASQKLNGSSTYSQKQLLGSESSGHFTYHTNIRDAALDLTFRDSAGRSIYTATYPFTVTAGGTSTLQPSQ